MRRSLLPFAPIAVIAVAVSLLTASLTQPRAHAASATVELGYDRIGLRRGNTWLLRDALDGGPYDSYVEETAGWVPVAGDTNGDGVGTVSLFRDGIWLLRDARQGSPRAIHFGQRGDLPVVGDWNGDGVASIGFFRGGRWYLRDNSVSGPTRIFGFGIPGDVPVAGDWDGNGRTDIAVVRGNRWYERDAASTGASSRTFTFGNPGDRRFAGDWDHDGRDQPGVFRAGVWYLRESNFTTRYQTSRFGAPGDVPVIRRTPGLAAGVTHRVIRDPAGPFTIHLATIDLAAGSTQDAVLSNERLASFETTSAMARRARAVLAVNGDFGLPNGRPVHAFASDGELAQTDQTRGRAVGFDLQGGVSIGVPNVRVGFRAQADTSALTTVSRWNSGAPAADELAAFTARGAGLESPPFDACYAGLAVGAAPRVHPDGPVSTSSAATRCWCAAARSSPVTSTAPTRSSVATRVPVSA
ncbi:MAG: VCBS repeat-containing protein, partial [Frankia sp.]|nr:VCBS repeat-containing protein [Frankia sp.]